MGHEALHSRYFRVDGAGWKMGGTLTCLFDWKGGREKSPSHLLVDGKDEVAHAECEGGEEVLFEGRVVLECGVERLGLRREHKDAGGRQREGGVVLVPLGGSRGE